MMEALIDLRTTWIFVSIRGAFIVLTALLVFHAASFTESADQAIHQSFSHDSAVNMYSLTDTLLDPEEFEAFRDSAEDVSRVGSFYNELNSNPDLQFLSMFDQPVSIANFQGSEVFDANFGIDANTHGEYVDPETGKLTRDVKALQMNEKVFDFYHLNIGEGSAPEWKHINYLSGEPMPVVLGENYREIYSLGDTLEGSFYFQQMTFVVVGFLEKDASVYFHGDMNTFLDDVLVLPYPPLLPPVTEETKYFSGILYFAMINGDMAVSHDISSEEMMATLASTGMKSGFTDYTLLGVPTYLIQLQLTRDLIQDNQALMVGIISFTSFVLVAAVLVLGTVTLRRRSSTYRTLRVLGESKHRIRRRHFQRQILEYAVTLIAFVVVIQALPNPSSLGILLGLLVVITACVVDISFQARQLSTALEDIRA